MSINSLNYFIVGLIVLLFSSNILFAFDPGITGGKLECVSDKEPKRVALIGELLRHGAKETAFKAELYEDGKKLVNGLQDSWMALAFSNPDKKDSWAIGIYGPSYSLNIYFDGRTVINSILGGLPYFGTRKEAPASCTFIWPEKNLRQ